MDRVRRVLSVAHRTKDDVAFRSMFTALLKHLRWVRDGTISSDEFDDWVSELEQQSAERRSAE